MLNMDNIIERLRDVIVQDDTNLLKEELDNWGK